MQTLTNWLAQHLPFPEIQELISTEVIGDEKINCHMAQEIGTSNMSKVIGIDFHSVKFKRKNNVISLASVNVNLWIDNVVTVINPLFIF